MVKNPPASAGDAGSVPGSGRFPRGGHGNPLQYSCLGNPMDRGAWRATVHRDTTEVTEHTQQTCRNSLKKSRTTIVSGSPWDTRFLEGQCVCTLRLFLCTAWSTLLSNQVCMTALDVEVADTRSLPDLGCPSTLVRTPGFSFPRQISNFLLPKTNSKSNQPYSSSQVFRAQFLRKVSQCVDLFCTF